jgi:AcrR family transcriptional regulator
MRGIARDAGVDPALVHHFYGTKRELFVATLELPFDPLAVVSASVRGDPRRAGERLARAFLDIWGADRGRAMMQSLLRSALADEQSLRMLREFVLETVLLPIVKTLAPDRRELRAALLASQLIGLAFVRYVARVEPLASADPDAVVAAIAPSLQRFLTRDLGTTPGGSPTGG